jgi:hypothetical protein
MGIPFVCKKRQFGISDYEDLKEMLGSLKGDFETQHIASELGHNMLEEGNKGKIVIEEQCIINQITFKNPQEMLVKKMKLQEGLLAAKSFCSGVTKSGASLGKPFPEKRGRGLSSILMMGWEIKIQDLSQKSMQIIVLRPNKLRLA